MSDELWEQVEEIRESGECNMMDTRCIQHEANAMGFFNLVTYIENNRIGFAIEVVNGRNERNE